MAKKVDFRDGRLEVAALIYLKKGKGLVIRDVDNLVKHILDALQGRFGATREANCLIGNDNRIFKVVVEKRRRPKNLDSSYGGKLVIRPYQKGTWR
jgi:Holliday junction resolvase RusA-like endonuclease